jgi:ADP-ribosylglycohydrolase
MPATNSFHHDRVLGCYLGAAIGDAMGGPVECMHAARIKRVYGEITGLLPYAKPPGLIDLQPGYAMHPDPGAITDDTFIRADFTRFFLDTHPPRSAALLASWLLAHADFTKWYPPMVEPLRRIERGEVTADECGLTSPQGGGAGWWTPIGIIHRGHPDSAAAEVRRLCPIWKAPLEQDLLAAAQAGVAEALRAGAAVDSVLEAMFSQCGPLAQALLGRALDIARSARTGDQLAGQLYAHCLVDEAPLAADAPLPPPVTPLPDSDEPYASILFAEQIPFALAAFVFGRGDPSRCLPQAVMLGRDADSIATTVGSWSGALAGETGLPRDWVNAVCHANRRELDLRALAERLLTSSPGP